jgi:hypothetical protein
LVWIEALSQTHKRLRRGALDRADTATESLRGLDLRQIKEVAHHDHRTLPWRQRAESSSEFYSRVKSRQLRRLRADFVRFMKFGATARAVLGIIDREVDQHFSGVSNGVSHRSARPVVSDLEQTLLNQILCILLVRRQQESAPQQTVQVGVDERVERGPLASSALLGSR